MSEGGPNKWGVQMCGGENFAKKLLLIFTFEVDHYFSFESAS